MKLLRVFIGVFFSNKDQEKCWCGDPVYKHGKCYRHYMNDLPGG